MQNFASGDKDKFRQIRGPLGPESALGFNGRGPKLSALPWSKLNVALDPSSVNCSYRIGYGYSVTYYMWPLIPTRDGLGRGRRSGFPSLN
jgi:hypothetical protein